MMEMRGKLAKRNSRDEEKFTTALWIKLKETIKQSNKANARM